MMLGGGGRNEWKKARENLETAFVHGPRADDAGSTLRSGVTPLTAAAAPAWKVNEVLAQTRLDTLVRMDLTERCSSLFA
jgi:hypothetical protein